MDVSGKSPVNIVHLANCEVLDEDGNRFRLARLWQQNTALFVFLRHFGCISCRAHAVQIWKDREKYEKSGTRIVFIGNGSPRFIQIFREELKLEGAPIYTDPELVSFRAAGFKRGFLVALGPRGIANGLKLFAEGHRQGKTAGDLWQLGWILAIRPSGQIAYHYISEVTGDFPPDDDPIHEF
jgi:peroxiredoxin